MSCFVIKKIMQKKKFKFKVSFVFSYLMHIVVYLGNYDKNLRFSKINDEN